MHICVIDLNGQFGPLNSLLDLLPPLQSEGFTFSFVVPRSVYDDVVSRLDSFEVKVVDDRSNWRREFGIARAIRQSARSTPGVDLVHANSTSAARGAVIAGLIAHRPVLLHLRNSKLSRGERLFLRVARALPVRLAMIAVSKAAADVAGAAVRVCSTIPDPVAAGLRREQRHPASRPVVGIVANMQVTKGFDVFVDIAHHLVGSGIQFTVFGSVGLQPVTSSYVREQRDRIDALGIGDAISFKGIVPDLRTHLPALDALLITSRRESFSRVAVEAMLAGLPLVAPDIPGLSATIGGTRFARTFPVGDARQAAAEVTALFECYETALETARAARVWAEMNFSPQVIAPQVRDVYVHLVERDRWGRNQHSL